MLVHGIQCDDLASKMGNLNFAFPSDVTIKVSLNIIDFMDNVKDDCMLRMGFLVSTNSDEIMTIGRKILKRYDITFKYEKKKEKEEEK